MNNAELTARMQQTWAAGDFNRVALGITEASQALVSAVDVRPGERVLDVACGSGNAALAAAHRHAEVVGLDYVPALIERARKRAEAEGSTVDFRVGDAQALPFEDHAFDVVLSVFGVIFAPDQERAMAELLRVTRPGGRIALATWMPEGMGGETFRAMSRHVPPPPGARPVVRWGSEAGLREISGGAVTFQLTPTHVLSVLPLGRPHAGHVLPVFRAGRPRPRSRRRGRLPGAPPRSGGGLHTPEPRDGRHRAGGLGLPGSDRHEALIA